MRIKEARKRILMTQKELAEKIGVDFSVISRYENGTIIPPANRLQMIADVLDVTVDYLLGNSEYTYDLEPSPTYVAETPALYSGNTREQLSTDSVLIDRYEVRNNTLLRNVLMNANGICELCGNEAPFIGSDGRPYLELHYIQWLSEGGRPIPENTAALCPNCHCKMHFLNDAQDVAKLKEAAQKHT